MHVTRNRRTNRSRFVESFHLEYLLRLRCSVNETTYPLCRNCLWQTTSPWIKSYITDGQLNVIRKKEEEEEKEEEEGKEIPKNQTRFAYNHSNYSSHTKGHTKRTISITCIWRSTHGWRNNEIVLRSYRNDDSFVSSFHR